MRHPYHPHPNPDSQKTNIAKTYIEFESLHKNVQIHTTHGPCTSPIIPQYVQYYAHSITPLPLYSLSVDLRTSPLLPGSSFKASDITPLSHRYYACAPLLFDPAPSPPFCRLLSVARSAVFSTRSWSTSARHSSQRRFASSAEASAVSNSCERDSSALTCL